MEDELDANLSLHVYVLTLFIKLIFGEISK